MCPLCDEKIGCAYWYLSDVCTYVKIAYLFDHPATVAYAVFVSFWGEIALRIACHGHEYVKITIYLNWYWYV